MGTKISETGVVGINTFPKISRKPGNLKTSEAVLHPNIVLPRNTTIKVRVKNFRAGPSHQSEPVTYGYRIS